METNFTMLNFQKICQLFLYYHNSVMNIMNHKIKPISNNDQSKTLEEIKVPQSHHENADDHKNQQAEQIVKVVSKRKLKRQHPILFWANIVSILVISSVNIPIFLSQNVYLVAIYLGVVAIICLPTFLINSYSLADTKGDICKLYFLFDGITIADFSAIIFFIGLVLIMRPPDSQLMMPLSVLLMVTYFAFQGNCKVILAYCKYKCWETIVFKLSLFIGMMIYIILAVYFIINSFDAISISKEKMSQFQEMFLLYIFAHFTSYMEIFNKINERDGSNQLQAYHLINYEGEMQEQILYEEVEKNKENDGSQRTTSKRK